MRVTFLVGCLTHGGAERVASLWIKGFVDRGYNVSVILMDTKSPISYQIPSTVEIKRVSPKGTGIKLYTNLIVQIRQNLKLLESDTLITILHPLGLFALIASFGLGIRIINTEHNTFDRPSYIPFDRNTKFQKYFVNKFFHRVTIFTHADIKYIGKKLNNMVYLPNPLSLQPVTSIPKKENVILAVGRMEAWHVKGFDLLIDAWNEICTQFPDWKLQILGGGSPECNKMLMERASLALKNSSIEFLDFTSDPQALYQKASIFILSSRYEGFGMVLLEAMSQGCACIACDYKGRQSEILNSSEMGICCQTDSKEAIKQSLVKMLTDSEYRESTRIHAIQRSKDFELSNIMDMWESIIKKCEKYG